MSLQLKIALVAVVCVSLFFNLYARDISPPCINADEAAFSYNAWSIAKTGKDEYGRQLPIRLQSYGDWKLPLLSYVTVPFVGVFGLNEQNARLPNTVVAAVFPIVLFFLIRELFGKTRVALLGSLLISSSLGMHIVGRHLHEGYLAAFLITLAFLFYVRLLRKLTLRDALLFLTVVLVSLFTYHSSRIFAIGFFLAALVQFLPRRTRQTSGFVAGFFGVLLIFAATDLIIAPARVANLIFFNSPAYVAGIQEMRDEGSPRVFYNKLMPGVKDVFSENLKYFSAQFIAQNGDQNFRFGHPGMPPITVLEYLLFFVGLYYLFKNREKHRFLISFLLFISPLAASLSWVGLSLTRSLFLLTPFLIVTAYGVFSLLDSYKKHPKTALGIFVFLIGMWALLQYYSWNFYINHYPKRAIVIRSWGCGYKELASYISKNYDRYDRFFITRQNGQPYMHLLFFLQYPPEKYHSQAKLGPLNEYGFGTVERFDKFVFDVIRPEKGENVVLIGFPDDFTSMNRQLPNVRWVQKIKLRTEEIFWIYDNAVLNVETEFKDPPPGWTETL